jgi:hypothetical protein
MAGDPRTVHASGAPWYRQFWPWFLIALPASSVLGGIVTVIIAVRHGDSLVRDDYYEAGLAINKEFSRERAAAERHITATLVVDDRRGRLVVQLDGVGVDRSAPLLLDLFHPTLAERDRSFRLLPDGHGTFTAELAEPLSGPRFVVLTPVAGDWRLAARIEVSANGPLRLPPS